MSLLSLADDVHQFLNEEKTQLRAAPSIYSTIKTIQSPFNKIDHCIGFSFQSVTYSIPN